MAETRGATGSNLAAPQNRSQFNPTTPSIRHRPLGRSATAIAEPSGNNVRLRRSSTFSDTVSEARQSFKSSTDDLFLPRVDGKTRLSSHDESPWQSAPLGLALLPAVGGVFFKNGTAVLTDITLLVLAAVFLNWSVRLPWDWYRSAQAITYKGFEDEDFHINVTVEEPGNRDGKDDQPTAPPRGEDNRQHESPRNRHEQPSASDAAKRELQVHELGALASCFVFPVIGAWLLHAIRSQLSRPSEGLVSNYNLTIFLLAAEIRPISHLLKMIQGRTLYLQRLVANSPYESERIDASKVLDLTTRLEELEAHVAAHTPQGSTEIVKQVMIDDTPKAKEWEHITTRIVSEARKTIQPDLDALNRAVRRYEKRTTVSTFDTDARLRDLEMRMKDIIALNAAARQDSAQPQPSTFVLAKWIYNMITFPIRAMWTLSTLPARVVAVVINQVKKLFDNKQPKKGKQVPGSSKPSRRVAAPKYSSRL